MQFSNAGILYLWTLRFVFSAAVSSIAASASAVQTNLAVTVRHAPILNCNSRIEGSLQQLLGENVTINGGFTLTGDLLVPGTPVLRLNSQASFGGTIAGSGSTSPTGYKVEINGNSSLRYLRTRTPPVTLPTVKAPPPPTGTRNVTITTPGQSIGNPATLRDLTLNRNAGMIAVPPGTYGSFIANTGAGFTLGIAGATQPAVYNLQRLTLNSSTRVDVLGPVIVVVANGITANGRCGTTNHSSWLELKIACGGLTLNGGSTVHASVITPDGTVIVNDNSSLIGSAQCDRLTLNAGGCIKSGNTVVQVVNQPPVVNAGPDLRCNINGTLFLRGSVSDDGLPSGTLTVTWSRISGPSDVTFVSSNATNTQATFNAVGKYVLRLTANDSLATNSDDMTVTVTLPNRPPTVSAGPRQWVTLPGEATLSGAMADDGLPEGGLSSVSWSKVSGPGTVTFHNAASTNTTAAFSAPGDYILRLTGSDSELTHTNDVQVKVRAAAINIAPVVSAGADKIIGLTNVAALDGAASDDGLPQNAGVNVSWSKVTGPGSVTFDHSNVTNTHATFSAIGTYVLRLTASDSVWNSTDDVQVTVYPRNQPPVVAAGPDQTITIPDPSVLVPSGATPTNAGTELSVSLAETAHWNHDIGQPGLRGNPPGSFLHVNFNGLDAANGKVIAAGGFTQAGTLPAIDWAGTTNSSAIGLAMWDGTNWNNFYDPRPIAMPDPPGSTTGFQGTNIGFAVTECGGFEFCNEDFISAAFQGSNVFAAGSFKELGTISDGLTDVVSRWTGTGWEEWGFKYRAQGGGVQVVKATSTKVYVAGGQFIFQATNAVPGTFTNLPFVHGVAVWDGTNWSALAMTDLRGDNFIYITSLAASTNGNVFVAGNFLMPTPTGVATNVAMWNGNQWKPLAGGAPGLSQFGGVPPTALAIAENGELYFGGPFTSVAGVAAHNIARWDGARWWPLTYGTNEGVNGVVTAIAIHGRDVYVGGQFSEAGGVPAWRLAKWDGQFWRSLTSFTDTFDGFVYALATDDSGLYVGGDFRHVGSAPASLISKWEFPKAPIRVARLSGSVIDDSLPVGSVLSSVWNKVSGPGDVTFADPHDPMTTASFSRAGSYILRLSANDTEFTTLDEVTVVVNANKPPIVSAGTNRVAGVDEALVLEGSVTDDGLPGAELLVQVWTVVNGPGAVFFDQPLSPQTVARFSAPGTYVLRLSANDSQFTSFRDITVQVLPANNPPQASAYVDAWAQTVTIPNAVTLHGMATDDGRPNGAVNYSWSRVSGPGAIVFANPSVSYTNSYTVQFATEARFSAPGTYVIRLTVTDSEISSAADVAVQALLPGDPRPPLIYAGPDFTVPVHAQALLNGVVSPPRAAWWSTPESWSQISIADPNSPVTSATFDQPGVFQLILNSSSSISDSAFVTVLPAAGQNQPPQVYAGSPRTVLLGSPVELRGQITDDGLPAATLSSVWQWIEGPVPITIANSNELVATVTFTNTGQYTFQLLGSDSEFLSASAVTLTVIDPSAGNQPPVVNAGGSIAMPLVTEFTPQINTAVVTDDGLPDNTLNYHWTQVSGPTAEILTPGRDRPFVKFHGYGRYVLRLTVNDGLLANSDDLVVTIAPGTNQAPSVDLGPNRVLYLPTNSITFAPLISDDGLPTDGTLTYSWSAVDGPASVMFSNPTSAVTTVTLEVPEFGTADVGVTYTLRLDVSDSELTTSRFLQVGLVDPNTAWNLPPQVNAGPDATNALPTPFLMQGSVSDDTLPWGFYSPTWTLVRGPAPVDFTDPNWLETPVTFYLPGVYRFRLMVTDFFLPGSDDVIITVLPAPELPVANQPPFVDAGPSRSIPITQPTLQLQGMVNDDGLPTNRAITVTWSLLNGPGDVTFSNAHLAAATAAFNRIGTYVLELTADDTEFASRSQVTVRVYNPQANLPPTVDPGSNRTITLPQIATLHGLVSDDGLPGQGLNPSWTLTQRWSLVSGPYSVTITDPGALQTDVQFNVAGDYVLRLSASDGALNTSADVTIHVNGSNNDAPRVRIQLPSGDIATGVDLRGVALDDGRPASNSLAVQWSAIAGPGTVTFSATSNSFPNVFAHAEFSAPGDYTVRLTANDGPLSASDEVTFTVSSLTGGNHAPSVQLAPLTHAVSRVPRSLSASITDDGLPTGGTLSFLWSQAGGPAYAARFTDTVATNTAVTFYLPGTYVVRFSANDGQLSSSAELTVLVDDPTNEPPLVITPADLIVTRPNAADLDGVVLDDGLPLGYPLTYQWSKVSGPGTVTFYTVSNTTQNATGREEVDFFDAFASATFSTNGVYVLRLTATDTQFTNSDLVTITVLPGVNSAPHVNAGPDQFVAIANPANLATDVTDDGLPDGFVEMSWSQVSGPGAAYVSTLNGVYRATFSKPGNYVLRLTADDGQYTSSDEVAITVYDYPAPIVEIISPVDSDIITSPTNIIGTASSPILESYVVEYRLKPADTSLSHPMGEGQGEGWSVLVSNTVSVLSNTLASFDPTLLLNGIYELRLTATDLTGLSVTTEPITVIVDRDLKIGHFTISFNDLAVPVAGLPLQITRTYDSRAAAAGIQGDFGVGWTLDIRNVRLQKNRPLSRNWVETTTGSPFDLSLVYHLNPVNARIVTITFPDGRVEKFQFNPNPLDQALIPIDYPQWRFTPIGNTRGTLVPAGYDQPDGHFLYFAGAIPGTANLVDLNFFFELFDSNLSEEEMEEALRRYPTSFRYTSPEGYKYLIDEIQGLQSVTDPNGNTLLIGTNSLTWTNAAAGTNSLSIAFRRDPQGRITNIVDAAGHAMSYHYGASGDLVAFADRDGNTNAFTYDANHRLLTLTDARGFQVIANQYNREGRLISATDALGQAMTYRHDLDDRRAYVTNRLGFVTVNEYDEHGNITRITDPTGVVSSFVYDQNGNLLVKSNANGCGCAVFYTYDSSDNRTSETDFQGNTTTYTYNPLRKALITTQPSGFATTNTYDPGGNLLSTRDSSGQTVTFAYNPLGKVVSITDPKGFTTRYAYNELGILTNEVNALGHVTEFSVDANGNRLSQAITVHRISGLASLNKAKNGWLLAGEVVLLPGAVTNAVKLVMRYEYSPSGLPLRTLYYDGSSTATTYVNGKPRVTTDALGRETSYTLNAAGQVTDKLYPDGCHESFQYNAEGNLTTSIDKRGQPSRFDYDPNGKLIRTIFADDSQVSATYYPNGALSTETSKSGETSVYGLDADDNRTSVTDASGTTLYTYNYRHHATSKIDPLNRTTRYEYDALGRNTAVAYSDGTRKSATFSGKRVATETDQNGHTTTYVYDPLGRLTSVANALGEITRYGYDEQDNKISEADPLGRTTFFEYDAMKRRTRTIYPDGSSSSATYDLAGRVISQVNQLGDETRFEYDAGDRLTKLTDPLGRVTQTTYDCGGNVLSRTDPDESVTRFEYDRLSRRIRTTFPDSTTEQLTYDSAGRLIARKDQGGKTTAFGYDLKNRLTTVTDPAGQVATFGYDAVGNRITETDALGQITRHRYDSLDRLVKTTYPDNTTREFTYDGVGRLIARKDQAGKTSRFTYDPIGRLLSASDPLGHVTAYAYDAVGNCLTLTDPNGKTTTFEYDVMNRRTRTRLPDGSSRTTSYDKLGLPVAETDALGNQTIFGFNKVGEQIEVKDALGHSTRLSYDAMGRVSSRADASQQTTTFQYDALGRLVHTTYPDGTSTSATYDAKGRRVSQTDQRGFTTVFAYDDLDRLVSQTDPLSHVTTFAYDSVGRLISRTDANNHATSFEYDALGRLTRVTHPDGAIESGTYDAKGRLISATDPLGHITTFAYDDANRLNSQTDALGRTTQYAYDAAGRLIAATDTSGRTTTFEYDLLGRLTRTINADGSSEQNQFDLLGRRTSRIDPAGAVSQYAYDAAGRLITVTDPLNHATLYAYDALNRLISRTDPNNHRTTYAYDAMGRRTKRTLPGGQFETLTYDPAGNLAKRTDFNGRVATYTYDPLGRLTQKLPDVALGTAPVSYEYNPTGQRTRMTDASGETTYHYDQRDRLVQKNRMWNVGQASRLSLSLNYTYDAAGNLTQIKSSDPNGADVTYEYDPLNRLSAVNDPRVGRTAYNYDLAGNLQSYANPNGVSCSYQYDALNRLTRHNAGTLQTPIANYTYTLGPSGNRLAATENLFGSALNAYPSTIDRTYTYDTAYQLTAETLNVGQASRLSLNYTYDATGNRLSRNSTVPALPIQNFSFDANDRLTSDTYDANGNTLQGRSGVSPDPTSPSPPLLTSAYDFENHLISATTDNNSIELEYDGDGQRVRKTVTSGTNTTTTYFIVDDLNPSGYPQVLEEHVAQNSITPLLQAVYSFGLSLLNADRLDGSAWITSFYGTDGHGNVRYLTDLNGALTDTYDYDAFGNVIAHRGNTPNHHLFGGEQFDPDLGLYYLRSRYADPGRGRFWTMDTFEGFMDEPPSLHAYTFNQNDPVNRLDPDGHYSMIESMTVAGLAPMVRQAALSLFDGVNHYAHGLAGGNALKFTSRTEAYLIDSLAVGPGWKFGKENFWAATKGAPFLLSQNPNIFTGKKPCWYECVPFDLDAPVYGPPAKVPMFEMQPSDLYPYLEAGASSVMLASGVANNFADSAKGLLGLGKDALGSFGYAVMLGATLGDTDAAGMLFGPELEHLHATEVGLGRLAIDAQAAQLYHLTQAVSPGAASEFFGNRRERFGLALGFLGNEVTGGEDQPLGYRLGYTIANFTPAILGKLGKARSLAEVGTVAEFTQEARAMQAVSKSGLLKTAGLEGQPAAALFRDLEIACQKPPPALGQLELQLNLSQQLQFKFAEDLKATARAAETQAAAAELTQSEFRFANQNLSGRLAHWDAADQESARSIAFWSGGDLAREAAEAFAKRMGGTTLELSNPSLQGVSESMLAQGIDWASVVRPTVWEPAAKSLAEGASGVVNVFQNAEGIPLRSVWHQVEYQALKNNRRVTIRYHVVMPDGSVVTVPQ